MAESWRLEKTIDGSELFYDFNCSVCIRNKGVHSEAAYYCPTCIEYYCKHCFIQSGCDHDPIGRGNVAKWGKPPQRILFDECPEHSGNTIQLYCPTDDVVCCAVCSQAHHKFCGEPKYIPLFANGKEIKESLKMAEKELQQLRTKLDRLLQDRTTSLADLDHTHKRITTEIREVKSKIIDLLDTLEQKTLNVVNKFKIDLSEKIKSELLCLNNIKAEMLELLSKIVKPNINDSLLFARLKQSKEILREMKQSIFDKTNSRSSEKVQFVADATILDCMKSLQGLGVLTIDTHDKQYTKGVGELSNMTQEHGHLGQKLNKPYTVGQKSSFNVKIKGDKKTCYILGMCQLPGGNIMVADFNNKSLKQLDSTYKVSSYCPLSASPFDVCNTEDGEVAVALGYGNAIQFVYVGNTLTAVTVGDTMTATRSFSTRHDCCSLAYHSKCIYVISQCGSRVYVYKPSGSLINAISTDRQGASLFSNTQYITVSPVSGLLYVADKNKGLVTINLQGDLLATFKPLELQCALSVCVDWDGNVFVGDSSTSTVLQVRQEGDMKVAQILSQSDGIRTWILCFDNDSTRLIVSSYSASDTVTVLQLAH